jgi:hypothetical protein
MKVFLCPYPHFLVVWTKLETFYFQTFSLKKRGNQLIRGKLSSLFTPPFRFVYFSFERKLEVLFKTPLNMSEGERRTSLEVESK